MVENRVKRLRLELGLSQERFARLLAVSLQTVRRWETGAAKPLPIIGLRLEELEREIEGTRQSREDVPMTGGRRKSRQNIEVGLGGLFKGMGSLFYLASKMAEEGKQQYTRTGEVDALGGKAKAVYGVSIRLGMGGNQVIEPFGNIKATDEGPVVADVREPLVDILDEGDRIVVIAELPGVEADDIRLEVKGDLLNLEAGARDRRYSKQVLLLSPVEPETLESTYRNGIIEIKVAKKKLAGT